MKKILSVFALAFVLAGGLFCEENEIKKSEGINEKSNEISVRAGIYPSAETLLKIFSDLASSLSNQYEISDAFVPTFTAEYLRNFNENHSFGGSADFGVLSIYKPTSEYPELSSKIVWNAALMLKYRYSYFATKNVRLYSKIGAGVGLVGFEASPSVIPAFQLVLLGINAGGGNFYFNSELGIGSEGSILTAGMTFAF